jgi:hypothetical protein
MSPDQRLAVIESPYSADSIVAFARNVRYARAAVLDAIQLGYAPLASHLLYTQEGILSEATPEERARGIACGHVPYRYSAKLFDMATDSDHRMVCLVYPDLGITAGMLAGIKEAKTHCCRVYHRTLSHRPDLFLMPTEEQAFAIVTAGLSLPRGL